MSKRNIETVTKRTKQGCSLLSNRLHRAHQGVLLGCAHLRRLARHVVCEVLQPCAFNMRRWRLNIQLIDRRSLR